MYGQHPTDPSSSSSARVGLNRFRSAPGSFLTRAVDSVMESRRGGGSGPSPSSSSSSLVGLHHQYHGHYFSGESSSESASRASPSSGGGDCEHRQVGPHAGGGSALMRQKSSPAGFLGHLVSENGFSITRGSGGCFNSQSSSGVGPGVSRLKSPLSFTGQDSLSLISEGSESGVAGTSSENRHQSLAHCYSPAGFGVEPWENGSSIAFSGPPAKRVKSVDGDFFSCLNTLETQVSANHNLEKMANGGLFQFSMPQTALEMATMDKLLNIPEDSVPCKIRAKRGCATHPRSIAERERRTRISGKLKKLQDLVPNMDKQTSYSDMLDLAVQHIKGLQNEVQKLHNEMENCTCGFKQSK